MGINIAARWGGEVPKIEEFSYSVSADGYIYTYSLYGESSFDYAEKAARFGVVLSYMF
jgi:outer membrane phospholipase A